MKKSGLCLPEKRGAAVDMCRPGPEAYGQGAGNYLPLPDVLGISAGVILAFACLLITSAVSTVGGMNGG
jgi:hypothetical protein